MPSGSIVKSSSGMLSNRYIRIPNLIGEVPGDRIDAKIPLLFCVGAVPAMQEEIGD
jgi:hypothetical protein